jgi:hypothetical protein
MRPTPPGLYRHYKGLLYEVVGMARHSETLEALTLYRALYGTHELWVRPAAMFEEQVVIDGRAMPRFERCAEQPAAPATPAGPHQAP